MDEETLDLTRLELSKNVVNVYQDGSFLVCTTDTNQRFRKAIPAGKILDKNEKGEWILRNLELRG